MAYVQYYTTSVRPWAEVCERVRGGEGEVFTCVIEVPAVGRKQASLAYGFFFRDGDGKLHDCLQKSTTRTMTAKNPAFAQSLFLEVYPDRFGFGMPVLDERYVVKPGEVTDQYTPTYDEPLRRDFSQN